MLLVAAAAASAFAGAVVEGKVEVVVVVVRSYELSVCVRLRVWGRADACEWSYANRCKEWWLMSEESCTQRL